MIETDLYAELQISCCQVYFRVSGRVAHYREEIPAEKNNLSILGITQIETRKEEKFSMKNACLKVEIVRLMVGTFSTFTFTILPEDLN